MHLSDAQRQKLCEMTDVAFGEIRQLAAAGKLEQAFDLAMAFHVLLDDIWETQFDLAEFRKEYLAHYHLKYQGQAGRDYTILINQIVALGDDDSSTGHEMDKTSAQDEQTKRPESRQEK